MDEKIKIFKVEFEPMYPVGGCLIIAAYTKKQANKIAAETLFCNDFLVKEFKIEQPCVIEYLSGDY